MPQQREFTLPLAELSAAPQREFDIPLETITAAPTPGPRTRTVPLAAISAAPPREFSVPLASISAGSNQAQFNAPPMTTAPPAAATRGMPPASPAGLLEVGNIDLFAQPSVPNPRGGRSTVQSFSVNFDGREVLLPTVMPDGRFLSE